MNRSQAALAAVLLALAGLAAFPIGCKSKSTPPTPAAAVAHYTVRGKVVALPDPDRKGSPELLVQHEAIPNFKDRDGTIATDPSTGTPIGMASMTMPFPLAKGVSTAGLGVGDVVEVTFDVDWMQAPAHHATAIRKLPPETVLKLGKD